MICFTKFVRYYPDQPEGWYELARIQAYLGLFRIAQKTLYRCLENTNDYYLVSIEDPLLLPLLVSDGSE